MYLTVYLLKLLKKNKSVPRNQEFKDYTEWHGIRAYGFR